MRNAFIAELTILAASDPRIMLIVGDLGYGVVDEFAKTMPEQFLNAGVAEQNMIGVAAGLASVGRKVFVYSIANFPTFRALEQIRNDICYHGLDVTVVAVGAGVAYGAHGYTHHAVEDISIMRALPDMTVLSPADPLEAKLVARFAVENSGPKYVRLGKNGESDLHTPDLLNSKLVSPLVVRQGADLTIASTGAIASECRMAAEILEESGIKTQVLTFPIIKPFPQEWVKTSTQGFQF
jgi:transketolase